MRVCVISPFLSLESEQSRPNFVRRVLVESGYFDVITLTSDFCHQTKKNKYYKHEEGIFTVRTLSYKKNTSIIRFLSHALLSFSLFFKAFTFRNSTDIYYITAPFALVVLLVKFFTKKKVVVDIVDFWPDSLPFRKNKGVPFYLKTWSLINRYSIRKADRVFSLSTEFLDAVGVPHSFQILLGSRSDFIEPCKKNGQSIKILYLGNIGVLYDFETLIEACCLLRGKGIEVAFEIVGNGDRKDWFLKELECNSFSYNYHGIVFDNDKLKAIASRCHVGFNGYNNTNASFSYKAASYFKYGLPIINSMNGDLYNFIEVYDVGINYRSNSAESLFEALQNISTLQSDKHKNVIRFFEEKLEYGCVAEKIVTLFRSIA